MINRSVPEDWRDLQNQVARILRESGLEPEVEKDIVTVRGVVNIDVYAEDPTSQPKAIYLCECKYWQSAIPKTIAHAFRTVVADYGANWGFIICYAGFQSGTFEAVTNSNVRLLTWGEFQELFIDRWIKYHMVPTLEREVEPLVEYTEPINARIFRKADALNPDLQKRFVELRNEYRDIAFFALHHYLHKQQPKIPLRDAVQNRGVAGMANLPDKLLDASCFRDFVDAICDHARNGIAAFDEVFGGRA